MPDLERRRRLGEELRRVRKAAGATTREVPGYKTAHVSQVENGKNMPSTDFIEVYVRTFGGNHATLYALYQAAVDESNRQRTVQRRGQHGTLVEPDNTPSDPYSPTAVLRSYTMESRESSYTFNSEGVLQEHQKIYSIRAREPHTRLFYSNQFYKSDRRRGVLRVEEDYGCKITRLEESDIGAVDVYLSLDREINPGEAEPYALSYRVLVNSSIRADPLLLYMPGAGTVLHHAVHAQFSLPALPTRIWWFAAQTTVEAESGQREEWIFPQDPSGHYSKDFYNLINGWCYGLCWQWPNG